MGPFLRGKARDRASYYQPAMRQCT